MPIPTSSSAAARQDPPDGFASTEWSLVLSASTHCESALDRLCRAYWRPVYIFVRASGIDRHEAEDVTQEFFADMLRRDWLKLAAPERGSFRGLLRTNVRFLLGNRRRVDHAQKRGSGQVALSLDAEACERELASRAMNEADPAKLFEQAWADCVLQAALARLASEQNKFEQQQRFEKLRPYLTHAPAPGDYPRLADELQMPPSAVALWVHRLTRRFAELVRAEVAATLADRGELEIELRYLLRLVAQKG